MYWYLRLTEPERVGYYAALHMLDVMAEHTHGSTMKHITKGKFEALKVPTPPKPEQHRVVGRIREMMERVEEAARLRLVAVQEVEHVEGAVFADFVEGHINGSGVPIMPLGAALRETQYGTSSKANTGGTGVPVLRMGNIKDGHLDVTDLKYIELTDADLAKYELRKGDLLINRTNSLEQVGKVAVFNLEGGPWVCASYLVRLVVDETRVLPEYIAATINSRIGRRYIRQTARRAIGMVNINVKEIRAMPIPVPSLEAQRAVVTKMADVRRAVQQMRELLPTFNEAALRAAILRRAFAGEL